jgi:hypothetical protein
MERFEPYYSPGQYGYNCTENTLKNIIGMQFYEEVKEILINEGVIISLPFDEPKYIINSFDEVMSA